MSDWPKSGQGGVVIGADATILDVMGMLLKASFIVLPVTDGQVSMRLTT